MQVSKPTPSQIHLYRTVDADPAGLKNTYQENPKTTLTARIVRSAHSVWHLDTNADLELRCNGRDRSAGASLDHMCEHHDMPDLPPIALCVVLGRTRIGAHWHVTCSNRSDTR